jgi:hypothetical protein
MLPQVRNDRNGMRRFQNTTFSIFNSPLSIRPKGARNARFARIENGKWIMENDRNRTRHFQNTIFSIFNSPQRGAPSGLLRRFASRNDDSLLVIAGKSPVIASERHIAERSNPG